MRAETKTAPHPLSEGLDPPLERDGNREAWGNRLPYFGRAVKNGGKFQTFCEEETGDVLPTNSKNTTRRMTSAIFRTVDGRLEITFYAEFAKEIGIWKWEQTEIRLSYVSEEICSFTRILAVEAHSG